MFNQLYLENNILFHAIVSQFLVNGTEGREAGEKMAKCEMWVNGGSKIAIVRVIYFINDPYVK